MSLAGLPSSVMSTPEVPVRVKRDDGAADLKVELERYSPMEGLGFGAPPRPAPGRPRASRPRP